MNIAVRSNKHIWVPISVLIPLLITVTIINPYYAIPFLFIVIIVSVCFVKPEILYYLTIFFIPIEAIHLDIYIRNSMHERIAFVNILLYITLISWFFARMAKTRSSRPTCSFELIIGFFMLWSTISLFWSDDKLHGIAELFLLCASAISIYLSMALIRNRRILNTALWVFIGTSIMNAIVSIYSTHTTFEKISLFDYQELSIMFLFNTSGINVRGHGFLHQNSTAVFITMAIFLVFGKILTSTSTKVRITLFIAILLMLTGCAATLSKGGLLGFISGCLFLIVQVSKLKRFFLTSILVILLLIIFSFFMSHLNDIVKTIDFGVSRTASSSEGDTSTSTRLNYWTVGMNLLNTSNGLGAGIGGYRQHNLPVAHAHSIYLSSLFDLGIIGFIVWFLILGGLFWRMLNLLKRCNNKYWKDILICYAAGYISLLVSGIVDFEYTYLIVWSYLGLGMALANIIDKELTQSNVALRHHSNIESY